MQVYVKITFFFFLKIFFYLEKYLNNFLKIYICFRSHLESKLKAFNQYYDGKSGGIRSREVKRSLKSFVLHSY